MLILIAIVVHYSYTLFFLKDHFENDWTSMFLTFETFSSEYFCNKFQASMNIFWEPDFKTSNLSFNVLIKKECIYFVAPIPYNSGAKY